MSQSNDEDSQSTKFKLHPEIPQECMSNSTPSVILVQFEEINRFAIVLQNYNLTRPTVYLGDKLVAKLPHFFDVTNETTLMIVCNQTTITITIPSSKIEPNIQMGSLYFSFRKCYNRNLINLVRLVEQNGSDILKFTKEVEEQKNKVGEVEIEVKIKVKELKIKVKELETRVKEQKIKVEELEIGVKEQKIKVKELETGVKEQKIKVEELEIEVKEFKKKIEQTTSQTSNDQANQDLLLLKQDLRSAHEDLRSAQEDLRSAYQRLDSAQEDLRSAEKRLRSAYQILDSANEDLRSAYQRLDSAQEDLRSAEKRLRSAYQRLDSANEDLRLAQKRLDSTNQSLKTANESLKYELNADLVKILLQNGYRLKIPISTLNYGLTILRNLFGYYGSTVECATTKINELWMKRFSENNKENFNLIASFGVSGQGKTELCREIIRKIESNTSKFEAIEAFVALLISFGQNTPWDNVREGSNIPLAIWSRCCYSFGFKQSDYGYVPKSIEDIIDILRQSAAMHFGVDQKKVAICLLMDEFLKLDKDSRKNILDCITGIQQSHILQSIPTFFFVTSLEFGEIGDIVTTRSKRPITAVQLPIFDVNDRRKFAQDIVELICEEVFSNNASVDIPESTCKLNRHETAKKLECVALHYVYHVGNHFRTLESFLKQFIKRYLPTGKWDARLYVHVEGLISRNEAIKNLCDPLSFKQRISLNSFKSLNKEVSDYFCTNLLLNDGEQEWINENDKQLWLDYHACYVGERNANELDKIKIEPNLPLLFNYWSTEGKEIERLKPPKLSQWLYFSLMKIVNCMKPSMDSAENLENLILHLLFVRFVSLKKKYSNSPISFGQIFPGAIINPIAGTNHSIDDLVIDIDIESNTKLINEATDVAIELLNYSSDAVFSVQGKAKSQSIEFVGPIVKCTDSTNVIRECKLAWTMKLRIPTGGDGSAASAANNSLEFIKEHFGDKSNAFYVVAVTCQKTEFITDLKAGTIAIPYETLNKILSPFGASYMLNLIDEKTQSTK